MIGHRSARILLVLAAAGVTVGCLDAENPAGTPEPEPAGERGDAGEGEGEPTPTPPPPPGRGEGEGEPAPPPVRPGEGEGEGDAEGEGEGEGPPPGVCESDVEVGLESDRIERWWWGGPPAEVVEVGLTVRGTGCVPLEARSSAQFVRAALQDDAVVVFWRDAGLPTGVHEAVVEVIEGEVVRASLAVRVELFAQAPPGSPRRALMIGIDGLRSDGLARAATPNIDRLAAGGVWTPEGSTHLTGDTVSGPGWASILTGVEVEKHGVDGNGDLFEIDRGFPTWLARAKTELGLATAVVSQWSPIQDVLIEADAMDHRAGGDHDEVTAGMVAVLAGGEFAAHFVHFDDVDHAGHARYDVPISNQSAVSVPLEEGQEVTVVIDGFRQNSVGGMQLRVIGVGDTCPDSDLGEAVSGAALGGLVPVAEGANADLPTRLHASCAGAARDTLLAWRAPEAGTYVFDTAGSDFDTVLALYAGACGEELACDDDGGQGRTSRLEHELAGGEEITIAVSGFRGRNGAWRLQVRREGGGP